MLILVLTKGIEVDFSSLSHSQTPTVAFNNRAVLNHSLHQRTPGCHSPLTKAPLWQDCVPSGHGPATPSGRQANEDFGV